MKAFLPVICSLFFIGCSESTSEQTPLSTEAKSIVTYTVEANTSTPEQKAPVPDTVTSIDGGALYGQKCASCHGVKGEKPGLGKSAVIAEFSEQQIKDALKGYQAGTYGKEMKGLMQGQAKALNDVQIDALAKFISAL